MKRTVVKVYELMQKVVRRRYLQIKTNKQTKNQQANSIKSDESYLHILTQKSVLSISLGEKYPFCDNQMPK